ncbi:MAG: redox-sensing transcriptional repressor Rex [Deltaproteobacteria bacterium]|nr:redox-sensing transcriptional repressor Rex [Deltaproteobacteria bacterium]MCK5682247.1 redox-sensing transcriptional repressor Rex [bacterium]
MKTKESKIPEATIKRLSTYINCLERLGAENNQVTSSEMLGESCQVSPAQIRKDLSYFGEFGVRGVGYDTKKLEGEIKEILGLNHNWPTTVVGVGKMGQALLNFAFFRKHGFRIIAAFDSDENKIGNELSNGVTILPTTEIENTVKKEKIIIGIITTPADFAQEVTDKLVAGGIKGLLNFAPFKVKVPETITLRNVSITSELDNLAYLLTQKKR